jgi:adenylate kinase family enzyme
MNLVLLGPPGVGTGTQGRLLAEQLGVPWLSSGDILRDAVREGTALGKRVEGSMRRPLRPAAALPAPSRCPDRRSDGNPRGG